MTDDVHTSANAGANASASGGSANGGGGATNGEPATGPINGTPSRSRPLLPRIKRSSVVAVVNETLDAVDQLADKLADALGLHGLGAPRPPAPPAPPEPPPPAAPPPPPPPAAAPPPPPPL